MSDVQLHDLRIRAKKLRYALEIDVRLHSRKVGRLIWRVKRLQDQLGTLHDLYVLGELIKRKREKWQTGEVTIIPAALDSALQLTTKEKERIYPLLYPLYSKVVLSLPPELYSFAGKEDVTAAAG